MADNESLGNFGTADGTAGAVLENLRALDNELVHIGERREAHIAELARIIYEAPELFGAEFSDTGYASEDYSDGIYPSHGLSRGGSADYSQRSGSRRESFESGLVSDSDSFRRAFRRFMSRRAEARVV